jgi:transcriptional regulator with XRE-family HTH domain
MDLAGLLRKERGKREMTQEEFADFLGLHPATLSRYMNGGKPAWPAVESIAEALGLPLLGVPPELPMGEGSCTIAELRNCLERLFPDLPGDDVDEIVAIARMKAERVGKALGGAARKRGS